MDFAELLRQRRTIRLFEQQPVDDAALAKVVNAARLASCASNMQRLRYTVVRTPEKVAEIFVHTAWAGKVSPRRTPVPGISAPPAFIIIHADCGSGTGAFLEADAGAAIQSMELAACDSGLGSCWLGAIDRAAISKITGIKDILYLLAVGYPAEQPAATEISINDDTAYFLDEKNVLNVPKIKLEDITQWI